MKTLRQLSTLVGRHKLPLGVALRVFNTRRRIGSSHVGTENVTYVVVHVDDVSVLTPLMFTLREFDEARQRAARQPEDVPRLATSWSCVGWLLLGGAIAYGTLFLTQFSQG